MVLALLAIDFIVILVTRWEPLVRAARSPIALRLGQVAIVALVLRSSPNAVQSFTNIISR